MKGTIFDIQRFSVHDGPGIRTTVFMKGCSLRCQWCHNPEGLSGEIQLQYMEQECIHCKRCSSPHRPEDVQKCPTGALKLCGARWEAEELLAAVLQDRCFYGEEGGVTFSGGECLLQADFVAEMLKRLKACGCSTVIDTAGNVPWENMEKTLKFCDLYLYDIKMMEEERHRKYTGAGNRRILKNLEHLCRLEKRVWIRIPVIPGVNDNTEEMEKIREFIRPFPAVERVTLIPYHTLGNGKYRTLGMVCPYHTEEKVSQEKIKRFSELFGDKLTG